MIKRLRNGKFILIAVIFMEILIIQTSIQSNGLIAELNNDKSSVPIPEARFGHSMIYDSINKKMFLFGGASDDRYTTSKNDLWIYDYTNNNWSELIQSFRPSERLSFAMTYDVDSQRIILFGGNSITTGWELDDTWVYDYSTNTWSNAHPTTRPPGRSDHAMAYDPVTKQTILFGGMRDVGETTYLMNDTWAYNYENNTWTELKPNISPQERYGNRMVYNSMEQKIVLFGGNSFGNLSDDGKLWTFDVSTTTWESLDPTEGSGPRYWYGLTYDNHRNELIVFGGTDLEPEVSQSNETWVYDFNNSHWTEVTEDKRPPACSLQSMVYDQENKKVVMFGGLAFESREIFGRIWIYDTNTYNWTDLEPGVPATQKTGFQDMIWITGLILLILNNEKRKK